MILNVGHFDQRSLALAQAIARAIDDADPIGLLEMGAPEDEYGAEIGSILPRVRQAATREEVTDILYEEFSRWFGLPTAGPKSAYDELSSRIWQAVQAYRQAG